MFKNDAKPGVRVQSTRPVITLEVYSGEQPWEDWIDQFESIAAINNWDKGQKLVWLKVCLAIAATLLELESNQVIAPVQVPVSQKGLMDMMAQLLVRLENRNMKPED